MSELGVAVVGLGVGAAHAREFAADARCDVRWLSDLDAPRAESMRDELGVGKVARDLDEILADEKVDAVAIASFDDAHFEQGLAVLKARKHLFVEKPLCRTVEEIEALESAWSATPGLQLASTSCFAPRRSTAGCVPSARAAHWERSTRLTGTTSTGGCQR